VKLRKVEALSKSKTLYLKNLNENIQTTFMGQALEQLFSTFGEIIKISVKASFRMKGQAFIIFKEQESADKALESLDGWILYEKPIQINYSRSQSDLVRDLEGKSLSENELEQRSIRTEQFKEWQTYIGKLRELEKLKNLRDT